MLSYCPCKQAIIHKLTLFKEKKEKFVGLNSNILVHWKQETTNGVREACWGVKATSFTQTSGSVVRRQTPPPASPLGLGMKPAILHAGESKHFLAHSAGDDAEISLVTFKCGMLFTATTWN